MSVSTAKSRISEDINENFNELKESTITFYSLFYEPIDPKFIEFVDTINKTKINLPSGGRKWTRRRRRLNKKK